MALGLDGVADIAIVADPVPREGTPRRKVVPSLLPRFGVPGPWPVRAIAGGITAASSYQWGMSVRAVPIGGGRLGWPGEHDAAPGGVTEPTNYMRLNKEIFRRSR